MSEFKGKKGPWSWVGGVLCNESHIVARFDSHPSSQDKALIAAAPELFEVLDLILSYHDDGNCVLHQEDVSMARAAIKKALGR